MNILNLLTANLIQVLDFWGKNKIFLIFDKTNDNNMSSINKIKQKHSVSHLVYKRHSTQVLANQIQRYKQPTNRKLSFKVTDNLVLEFNRWSC